MKPLAEDGATAPRKRPPLRADLAVNQDGLRADPLDRLLADVRDQLSSYLSNEDHRLRDRKLEALAEFAAGAAHEINTPLAIISGQAQHLLKSENNTDRRRSLDKIIGQAQRIHVLFRDLMVYARPPKPNVERIDLAKLVRKAAEPLQAKARERRVRLKLSIKNTRLKVEADPGLLEAAVVCLLRNALEAAPSGGWVRLSLVRELGKVAVVVEDNGPGLANGQREHLFDPFYSGRTAGRGSGLGLSKVWRVAQLHGGEVKVTSVAGRPTRFELILPVPRRAAPSANGHLNGRKHGDAQSQHPARR